MYEIQTNLIIELLTEFKQKIISFPPFQKMNDFNRVKTNESNASIILEKIFYSEFSFLNRISSNVLH